jgi:hypothetical protein
MNAAFMSPELHERGIHAVSRGAGGPNRQPAQLAGSRATPAVRVCKLAQVGRGGPLADLLGQCDDDVLGAAEVTEPVAVLVLRHLAEEFGAVGAQAGKDVLDVF